MIEVIAPICFRCRFFNNKKYKKGFYICKAYSKGIPKDIILSKVDHKKPYKGDHGIQFESIE